MSNHYGVVKSLLWSPLVLGAWVAIAPPATAQDPVVTTTPQSDVSSELAAETPLALASSEASERVEVLAAVSSLDPSADSSVVESVQNIEPDPALAQPSTLETVDDADTTALSGSDVESAVEDTATVAPAPLSTDIAVLADPQVEGSAAADLSFNSLDSQDTAAVAPAPSSTTLAQRQVPPDQSPVTSVDELSDVQPGIWYYDAITNLVNKYQCVAGYPDGTFRPRRSISRAEMAVLLNNCLEAVAVNQEDIETIKALQEEFAAELATLRGRVDGLDARVATVEAQQFSTTTKLSATAAMLFQFGDTDGGPFVQSGDLDGDGAADLTDIGDSRASAIAAVYMSFNTSFSGDDLLETTLFFGNNGQDTFSNAQVGSTPLLALWVQCASVQPWSELLCLGAQRCHPVPLSLYL